MNPFEHSRSIAFELSNACNLAWHHAACPLRGEMATPFTLREPVTLPAQIVADALTVLASYDWRGVIQFHQYNEPLLDPRLFTLIDWARKTCPDSRVELATNGFNLTPQLARELAAQGVSQLHVTLYGSDGERAARASWLTREHAPVLPTALGWHELDRRLDIYDRAPNASHEPCGQPLADLLVTCRGHVGLCCFDWRRTVTFGDLRAHALDAILLGENAQWAYALLSRGDRFMNVCQRCDQTRGI